MKRIRVLRVLLFGCSIMMTGLAESQEQWWRQSSLTQKETDELFRWHIEIAGGAESLNGNESGDSVAGRWLGVLRYGRFSTYLDGNVDFQDKDYGQMGSVRQNIYMVRGMLRYDLYKEWYTAVGTLSERDDSRFVARRDSIFWGGGQRTAFPGNVDLRLFAAYGREHSLYDDDIATAFGVQETEQRGGAIILSQDIRWQVKPQVALAQDGMLVIYTDSGQEDRWQIGGGPEFSLLPHLSLLVRYEARIEDNPVLEAISGKKRNEKVTVMLRLSY